MHKFLDKKSGSIFKPIDYSEMWNLIILIFSFDQSCLPQDKNCSNQSLFIKVK